MELEEFTRSHLHRTPMAGTGTAASVRDVLGWPTVDRVLRRAPAPDVLPVLRGVTMRVAVPRDLAELRVLMSAGIGLVIQHAERHDGGLAAFAEHCSSDLPGEIHLQLFITATGTHGFGWHYDFEDVFIAHAYGIKDYYLRDNTVDRDVVRGTQPHFERVHAETSPMHSSRLLPGDWLYIPARWWHAAICREEALSISVGVYSASR